MTTKAWRRQNRAKDLAYKQMYRRTHPDKTQSIRKERRRLSGATVRAELLAAQGNRCYLCGNELPEAQAVIEHDHRCHVSQSCAVCRRGAACTRCNFLIGLAEDSPDLLRQIADNLAAALALVEQRLAEQQPLFPLNN